MDLDHTQDLHGVSQHRLTQLYSPPDFVKQASHEQLYGGDEPLPAHIYGSVSRRVYPCHTKAATWMSALFFADTQQKLPKAEADTVRERLIKSANHWGIQHHVTTLWEKMAADAAVEGGTLPDSAFAMVWVDNNKNKERRYPLRNAQEVKTASDWFGRYHDQFAFADKHTIATKILSKAASFGAVVMNSELLDRCAGYGYCAAEQAAEAWEKRAGLVRASHSDYAEQAMKIAKTIREGVLEARDQGKRIKMASLMDQFDNQTHISRLYGDSLERPEDVLFCITEKVASEFVGNHVQTTTGAVYEKMALDKLDIGHVRKWLGDEFADEVGGVMLDVTKLAAIVPTLPRPEAEMFERMTNAAGISVFAREKAAMDRGLTMVEMESLAAEYKQGEALHSDDSVLI